MSSAKPDPLVNQGRPEGPFTFYAYKALNTPLGVRIAVFFCEFACIVVITMEFLFRQTHVNLSVKERG